MARPGISLYNPGMPIGSPGHRRLRVNSCGLTRCAPDWRWDTAPGLPDFDLIVVHAGTGEYRSGGRALPAGEGRCMLFRRGDRVIGSMDPADPMTVTWVHFDFPDRAGRPGGRGEEGLPELERSLQNPAFFYALLERIRECWSAGSGEDAAFWLRAALAELLRQDARPELGGGAGDRARAIRGICEEIRAEPGRRWRLAGLARRLYCSPDHFARLFRRHAGFPPGEFIVRARLDAAMGLLRSSSHSVGRIAELLGYCDVYAFSRQFRRKTGVTPTAYRRGAPGD
jgi:AraC-like DNA-binding protein